MNTGRFSEFMLEKYRLGELSPEDKKAVIKALEEDDDLRSRLNELEASDKELRNLYPIEYFEKRTKQPPLRLLKKRHIISRFTRIAAVAAVCILLPLVYFLQKNSVPAAGDRIKGSTISDTVLMLYLKGIDEAPLSDKAVLSKGDTVQLAYTAPAGSELYGVIFSIDGRSEVTMHYPYRKEQSALLVSGRRAFLSEAYMLDDAPLYEVFVMVLSKKPLDTDTIRKEAHNISAYKDMTLIEEKCRSSFKDCEVEIISVLKK
jgi:hypothetical protein